MGGASAEHWKASEIVDFALMYTALTFRKAFNSNNKRDILQRLKEVINSIKPVTEDKPELTWKLLRGCRCDNVYPCLTSNGSQTNKWKN